MKFDLFSLVKKPALHNYKAVTVIYQWTLILDLFRLGYLQKRIPAKLHWKFKTQNTEKIEIIQKTNDTQFSNSIWNTVFLYFSQKWYLSTLFGKFTRTDKNFAVMPIIYLTNKGIIRIKFFGRLLKHLIHKQIGRLENPKKRMR